MSERDIEIERLRRWKAEALPVISGLQELGRVLGVGLGRRITGPDGLKAAEALVADRDRAVAQVAAVRRELERWDGYGHGEFNIHMPENLPCSACNLMAAIRAEMDAALDTAPASPGTDQRCALCGDDDPSDCDTHGLCCDPCHDDPHGEPTTDQRIEARRLSGEHVGRVVVLPDGDRGTVEELWQRGDEVTVWLGPRGVRKFQVLAPSDVVTLIGGEE